MLDYHSPETRTNRTTPAWNAIEGVALLIPFFVVPVFFIGLWVVDDLWPPFSREMGWWVAVPTGAVTVFGLVGAIHALCRAHPMRGATIFGIVGNGLTLGYITWTMLHW